MSDAEGYQAVADSEVEAAEKRRRTSWVRRWRWQLIIGGPIVVLVLVGVFVLLTRGSQSTDNAYVQVAKAPVSTSVDGRVIAVYVKENQHVRAGQPLFRLDSRDFKTNAAQAQAQLAQAEFQARSLGAAYRQQQSAVAAAQEMVAYTAREAERQRKLVVAGVSSQQQADQAAHAAQQALKQLATARQEAAGALATIGGDPNLPVDQQPAVLAAQAQLKRAQLNMSYTEVVAPTDGIVTRVEQLQPGAYVNASQTVFWLLTGQPWIEANFKEDQLAKMRVGQPVDIEIDAFPDADLTGHVASFSPGTGSVFSALPAQNATGNWVKVTQRLPVRIDFDHAPPEMAGRAGLSARVKVDTRVAGQSSQAAASAQPQPQPRPGA